MPVIGRSACSHGVHFTAPGALAMVTTLDGQLRSIGALP